MIQSEQSMAQPKGNVLDDWARFSRASSVLAALEHLRTYRDLPHTVPQAVEDLKQLLLGRPLYRLYQHFFPREWARSRASFRSRDGEGYCPREIEFFRLIDRHLFPFDLDFMLDEAADGGRMDVIEILPYARRWWEDAEEMELGWRLLLVVSGALSEQGALLLLESVEDLEPKLRNDIEQVILREGPGYAMSDLTRLCELRPAPLIYLPLAFSMTLYDTGNLWLDIPGDDGTMPFEFMRWCEHDIEVLTETYREAQEIEHRAGTLVSWLESDVSGNMRRILTLVEQASPQAQKPTPVS